MISNHTFLLLLLITITIINLLLMDECSLKIRYKDGDNEIMEIGIDEAGRGSFFGPIVAGAVIWPDTWERNEVLKNIISKIKDSKKLSPKRRNEYAEILRNNLSFWGIGVVDAYEINNNGIQWANIEAFRRAVCNLYDKNQKKTTNNADIHSPFKFRIVLDGSISMLNINEKNGKSDFTRIDYIPIKEEILEIDGDAKYISVAAASILAKVEHDNWIQKWCEKNIEISDKYDLLKSKGYGTTKHREGLVKWGALEEHRTQFIRKWNNSSSLTSVSVKLKDSKSNSDICLIQIPPKISL